MSTNNDELARRRAGQIATDPVPATAPPSSPAPDDADAAAAAATERDASAPDVLDLRAAERDTAARERDLAARVREQAAATADQEQQSLDRMLAARDRAAAALDREEAALDRHRAAEYLRRTYRDSLTGTLQRDSGRDVLSREVARAHRASSALAIAFLDVVGLKRVNDERGHESGDALLRNVGAALIAGLRGYDVIVRYGGDEFVCALPDTTLSDAEGRLADVQAALLRGPGVELSVGVVELGSTESLDEVIARADGELYERRAGRSARPKAAR